MSYNRKKMTNNFNKLMGENEKNLKEITEKKTKEELEKKSKLMFPNEPNILHVHGQSIALESVEIIGTKESLILLMDAINDAIKNKYAQFASMCNDGEHYAVFIVCFSETEMMEQRYLPYYDRIYNPPDYEEEK